MVERPSGAGPAGILAEAISLLFEHMISQRATLGGTHSNSTNCMTDMPEARINDRSVPGANSRCWGMDKLAGCPGLIKITWLPCCLSLPHPAF